MEITDPTSIMDYLKFMCMLIQQYSKLYQHSSNYRIALDTLNVPLEFLQVSLSMLIQQADELKRSKCDVEMLQSYRACIDFLLNNYYLRYHFPNSKNSTPIDITNVLMKLGSHYNMILQNVTQEQIKQMLGTPTVLHIDRMKQCILSYSVITWLKHDELLNNNYGINYVLKKALKILQCKIVKDEDCVPVLESLIHWIVEYLITDKTLNLTMFCAAVEIALPFHHLLKSLIDKFNAIAHDNMTAKLVYLLLNRRRSSHGTSHDFLLLYKWLQRPLLNSASLTNPVSINCNEKKQCMLKQIRKLIISLTLFPSFTCGIACC